jgi:hypothetical protein
VSGPRIGPSITPSPNTALALFLGRIGVQQHGLRERYEPRAEDALQQAEDHDLRKRYGGATQHRGHHETDYRRQE